MKNLLVLFVWFVFSVSLNAQYSPGDKVEDFKLKGMDGKMFSMMDQKDAKGFILVFTCNTCPVAIKYEDRIVKMHNKFAPKGFPVVAVNSNDLGKKPGDSMEEMKKRAKDKGFKFAYLRDDDQSSAKRFGAERTPEIYLLVKEGNNLVLAYTGAIDNNPDSPADADKHFVSDAISDIVAGKKVKTAETRAIGCTIKWAD